MNRGTPLVIEVLLHCHIIPTPHPRADTPAVAEAIISLEAHGLIEKAYPGFNRRVVYRTTEKGKAHIRQLCRLPFPTQAWISADGKTLLTPGENGGEFQWRYFPRDQE